MEKNQENLRRQKNLERFSENLNLILEYTTSCVGMVGESISGISLFELCC